MKTLLEEYNRKRDFTATPEPEGRPGDSGGALRFVVQRHLARREHYDFRIEWGGALLSWAVPKAPSYNPKVRRLAVEVEPHPLEYRDFEGTIPKGEYGGGTVMLWDEGTWEPQSEDVEKMLRDGALKMILHGQRMKGKWALVRLKPRAGERQTNWLLLKERDAYAREEDGTEDFTTSVRTGRTIEEIEAGERVRTARNPFAAVEVQLAKLASAVPEGEGWLFETKYDGYRIVAFVEPGSVRLLTRNGLDYTHRFPTVAQALSDLAAGRAFVLDGEMVVPDEAGRPDFQALQGYLKNPGGKTPVYMAFDLLALDGDDLRSRPLIARKAALERLLQKAPAALQYSRHVEGQGKECFEAACRAGLEGVVGKRKDAPYTGGRSDAWIKLKCGRRQEFVVGGYTRTEKRSEGVSALLLGVYEAGKLLYCGRAGTGLSEAEGRDIARRAEALKTDAPPFVNPPKARAGETVTWLRPELVAEVKFAEWTEEGLLRQASFKGLRFDKEPKEITRESAKMKKDSPEPEIEAQKIKAAPPVERQTAPGGPASSGTAVPAPQGAASPVDAPPGVNPQGTAPSAAASSGAAPSEAQPPPAAGKLVILGITITHPDRVVFEDPAVTKGDVARYYEAVSDRMLPCLRNRVLSVVRCPKGLSSACFFKKHPGGEGAGVVTVPVPNSEGETEVYFSIDSAQGLVFEAQMGTIEFHAWCSRFETLEQPDMMVFDLDPDEGLDLAAVRQGVRDLKSVLDELGLVAYLKTSGGKGYHVVVPWRPAAGWDAFYAFARRVAEVMEQKWPERYTANMRKNRRAGKIFIDWARNGRGATSVAPYSLRARPGAKVSMPIAWEELDTVAPDGVDIREALRRLGERDPWEGFFRQDQILR